MLQLLTLYQAFKHFNKKKKKIKFCFLCKQGSVTFTEYVLQYHEAQKILWPHPTLTHFNGTDRAGRSFMSNATNPSLLWHCLKFILITIETKDKFPSAPLKQLHLWLFFLKCKEGRSVMWDLMTGFCFWKATQGGLYPSKWFISGNLGVSLFRRIPVIISWTECFERLAASSRCLISYFAAETLLKIKLHHVCWH